MVGPTTNQKLERQRIAAKRYAALQQLKALDPAAHNWLYGDDEFGEPINVVIEYDDPRPY